MELELHFNQPIAPDSAFSFAPLQAATALSRLTIRAQDQDQLAHSQLQHIRQLAVTQLQLYPCFTATLLSLLQMEGPPLRWTKLSVWMEVDDEVASLLPTLQHLTELSSSAFCHQSLSSFVFLSQMPALRSLMVELSVEKRML